MGWQEIDVLLCTGALALHEGYSDTQAEDVVWVELFTRACCAKRVQRLRRL